MYFLGRLHDSIAGVAAPPAAREAAAAAGAAVGNPAEVAPTAPAATASAPEGNAAGLGGAPGGRSGVWAPVRRGQWREELKANVCHVPAEALVRLEDHT